MSQLLNRAGYQAGGIRSKFGFIMQARKIKLVIFPYPARCLFFTAALVLLAKSSVQKITEVFVCKIIYGYYLDKNTVLYCIPRTHLSRCVCDLTEGTIISNGLLLQRA